MWETVNVRIDSPEGLLADVIVTHGQWGGWCAWLLFQLVFSLFIAWVVSCRGASLGAVATLIHGVLERLPRLGLPAVLHTAGSTPSNLTMRNVSVQSPSSWTSERAYAKTLGALAHGAWPQSLTVFSRRSACLRSARREQRTVSTQTLIGYKFWWQQPRYLPVNEGNHGCWVE